MPGAPRQAGGSQAISTSACVSTSLAVSTRAAMREVEERNRGATASDCQIDCGKPVARRVPREGAGRRQSPAVNLSAIRRMELYHLPETCEWSAEQVLDIEFWPT